MKAILWGWAVILGYFWPEKFLAILSILTFIVAIMTSISENTLCKPILICVIGYALGVGANLWN